MWWQALPNWASYVIALWVRCDALSPPSPLMGEGWGEGDDQEFNAEQSLISMQMLGLPAQPTG